MEKQLNIKINYLLNFATISDEFSGRNSYSNFIKLATSYGQNEYNRAFSFFEENDNLYNSLISNIHEEKEIYNINEIDEKHNDSYMQVIKNASLDNSCLAHVEYKKLLENMKTDHPIIKTLNQLVIMKSEQDVLFNPFRSNQSKCFYGKYDLDRKKIYIGVDTKIPLKVSINSISNDGVEEIKKMTEFYKKYPSLVYLGEDSVEEAINNSIESARKIANNFICCSELLKHDLDTIGQKYSLFNSKILNYLDENTRLNGIISNNIEIENVRGEFCHSDNNKYTQLYNLVTLDIAETLKLIKKPILEDANNAKQKRNTAKMK